MQFRGARQLRHAWGRWEVVTLRSLLACFVTALPALHAHYHDDLRINPDSPCNVAAATSVTAAAAAPATVLSHGTDECPLCYILHTGAVAQVAPALPADAASVAEAVVCAPDRAPLLRALSVHAARAPPA